jgi:hypothetical protein
MIAACGLAYEPEPGLLYIRDDQVKGVHLTLLKPDGSGKAGTEAERDKLMVGSSSGWPIMLAPKLGPDLVDTRYLPAGRSVGLLFIKRPLMALFGHPTCTDECPLSGVKRT